MKYLLLLVLLGGCTSTRERDSCEQGEPCQGSSVAEVARLHEVRFTAAMQQVLDQLIREKSKGEQDPDKLKAMQVLAKTDAAKSYALTEIYAVSVDYCPEEVRQALIKYQNCAASIIRLGHYYYQHGIQAQLDDKDLSQSGEALTTGLNEMLERLHQEHRNANPEQLGIKCRQARQALDSLAWLYGGY